MEELDQAKNLWQSTPQNQEQQLGRQSLEVLIKLKVKSEKKHASSYFWLAFIFQNMMYALAVYLFIQYWGNTRIMLLCGAGILLYLPFTIMLMWRFKAFFRAYSAKSSDLISSIRHQHDELVRFFTFKKWFDLLFVPLNAVILSAIIFEVYLPGGYTENLRAAIIVAIPILIIYAIAVYFENRNHFIKPIQRFRYIIHDLERTV